MRNHSLQIFLLLGALALCASGHAAVFTVSSTADSGAGTLREAVEAANDTVGQDTIVFSEGLGLILISSGPIDITSPLIIEGSDGRQVISGGGSSRVFRALESAGMVTLRNLEIIDGFSEGDPSSDCSSASGHGAAICSASHLTIEASVFSQNTSERSGGAVFVLDANLTIRNSYFLENRTLLDFADGGAVFHRALSLQDQINIDIESSSFEENSTLGDEADGGAVALRRVVGSISHSGFIANRTDGNQASGGALSTSQVELLFDNILAHDNTVANGCGGAFLIGPAGLNDPDRKVSIYNSTFSHNSSPNGSGGAICAVKSSPDLEVFEIINSTLTDNVAESFAGAVQTLNWTDVRILNSTLTRNRVTGEDAIGSGLLVSAWTPFAPRYGRLEISSSILSGNEGADQELHNASFGANQIFYLLSHNVFGNIGGDFGSDNIFTPDPMLSDLAENGCAMPAGFPPIARCVQTAMPLSESPAILNGINSLGLNHDQRGPGFPRSYPQGTTIGAVSELSGPSIAHAYPVNVLDQPQWILLLTALLLLAGAMALAKGPGRLG